MTFMDSVKYGGLKLIVILIYIVSHLYDYISYPIYLIIYHPWRVRRYRKSNHARREDRDDCVLYHSLQEPTDRNVEIERHGLDTMDKVLSYVSEVHEDRDCLGTREILGEEDEVQPNGKKFKKYILGSYTWRTFGQFGSESESVGQGLKSLGLKSQDRIAILAETRAEWMILANGCFRNNITIVTLYTNLGKSGIAHAVRETEIEVLVCSHETIDKVKAILKECPSIKTLIFLEPQSPALSSQDALQGLDNGVKGVLYQDLVDMGNAKSSALSPRCPPTENDCAIIMYTSGSTGNPKGVMLSHKNLLASMSALMNIAKFRSKDRYIAYLPLAHVLELLAETTCLFYGIKIGYSSPATLTNKSTKVKAGSKGDANVLKPTLMCSVPLILERIYKSIVDTMKRQGWAVEELFHYFMQYKMKWQDRGFDTPLLNKTLFRKIRYFLGGRVKIMLSGGAPLSPDTHSLTRTCICVPLMQGYGLTETTACATVTSKYDRTTGRAGAPLMNIKIKLVSWEEGNYLTTDKPYPRGEIHIGGDNVALGYYKNPEKTSEEFYDEDGRRWFKTGDIGEFHDDGVLKIIDRKKDLVKLQHGEYVSYGKVEAVLKTCPIVEHVCLYGDSSKTYLLAVMVPDKVHLKDITSKSVNDVMNDKDVHDKIVKLMGDYGLKNNLEKFELPAKLVIVGDDWTPETGLVTAAFKIRRKQIVDNYRGRIDKIYV